ncbi:ATP-dependent Clp protease proteolytic subunit 5 [Asimina triloba]
MRTGMLPNPHTLEQIDLLTAGLTFVSLFMNSMGAFLLCSGTKGKRYSLPNSRIMIHQPLGGAQGSVTDFEIQCNEMLHHKANLASYLAYHTGQRIEKIHEDTERDFFMSPIEAKDYGMIDGIILNPLKALQQSPTPEALPAAES